MFLLDRMLVGGLGFVLDQVSRAADAAANDEETVKQDLLAAQLRLELGEISVEEFAEIEQDALAKLRRSREERREVLDAASLSEIDVRMEGDEV